MCGILCVLECKQGGESIKDQVLKRVRRLRHRGPDWSGTHLKGKNLLAHERLSIVDVEHGAQPLYSESKELILAVNGEIYNHQELRDEVRESTGKFQTSSDCECIINLYEKYGTEFLNKLNGIFAFVLLDEKKDTFLVARDHMGICPLYFGRDKNGTLWVASELKALADICVTFSDFPPGHYLTKESGTPVQWYKPTWFDEKFLPTSPIDLTELRTNLESAVTRQLMSDVPYGVLLSGGLDSSVVAAIASRICSRRIESKGQTAAWWPRLHSFSIGLSNSPDLAAARKVAKFLDTVHHEYIFTLQEGLDAIHDVIYQLETYDVTTIRAATPMYLMARRIKTIGVKMVLSGEGADEIFGGYLYFHKAPNAEEFHKENVRKVKDLHKFDCLRANKAMASWGVEARVPFLDREFMDYALTNIDPADKLCGLKGKHQIEKWILREAFQGYLPDEILWRQKEQFSDGVGYGWIDGIQAYARSKISDEDLEAAKFRFPHNPPPTKEAFLIRSIFHEHFPQSHSAACVPGGPSVACSTPTAILWDQSFKKFADCSGRSVLGVHVSAYDQSRRAEVSHAQLIDDKQSSSSSTSSSSSGSSNGRDSEGSSKKRKQFDSSSSSPSSSSTSTSETNGDKRMKSSE